MQSLCWLEACKYLPQRGACDGLGPWPGHRGLPKVCVLAVLWIVNWSAGQGGNLSVNGEKMRKGGSATGGSTNDAAAAVEGPSSSSSTMGGGVEDSGGKNYECLFDLHEDVTQWMSPLATYAVGQQ